MRLNPRALPALLLAASLLTLGGCSDDDPTTPVDESRTFTLTLENISADGDFSASGVFAVPVGGSAPAPIGPGQAYEFSFGAAAGQRLSFATMFVQSNDLFYAPDGQGIALFNGTTPVTGDVTSQVMLWDAGTEINQEPGSGADQAPRQSGPDTGAADANAAVRVVSDGFTYPATASVVRVTLSYANGLFTCRIENVSTATTLMPSGGSPTAVPLAPGVWGVHSASNVLFTAGAASSAGLEDLAEDGSPDVLAGEIAPRTGIATPLAPAVVVVATGGTPLFTSGQPDAGMGLEALAEDGDPTGLVASLDGAAMVQRAVAVNTPVGGAGPAPALPGQRYQVTFEASPGDRLSFATMFVQSNDLFYAFDDLGVALFDGAKQPRAGDMTAMVSLWDAGTEVNQWPGVGADQAPRQSGPDTGAADPGNTVREVNDGFPYPATDAVIRVTLAVAP